MNRWSEQAAGLQAFVERFFAVQLSKSETLGLLDLLDAGHFAARDIPRLISELRQVH